MKKKFSKKIVTILILLLIVSTIHLVRFIFRHLKNWEIYQVSQSKTLGDPHASLSIIEFTDFLCPACARGAVVLKDYLTRYPTKIYLQYRYFPLVSIHRHALKGAIYAECAAQQGKFWEYHDLLVKNRRIWGKTVSPDKKLKGYAVMTGLNMKKMEECLKKEDIRESVLKEKAQGTSMGVKATPTYFLNGKMVIGANNIKKELQKYFHEENNGLNTKKETEAR